MANDLLLRLFNSEFFNAWIAVSYLYKYAGNSGIQRYLCESLKKFPSVEIEFFLPQLMHLLVTQPTVSLALEDTLIDLGKQSPHFAVMSIWYLQAYMSDWSMEQTSPSYQLCERMLNKCQAILLMDQELPPSQEQELTPMILASQQNRKQSVEKDIHHGLLSNHNDDGDDDNDNDSEVDMTTIYNTRVTRTAVDSTATITTGQFPVSEQVGGVTQRQPDITCLAHTDQEIPTRRRQSSQPLPDSYDGPKTPPLPHRPFSFSVSLEDLHGGKAFSLSRYLANHMKWPQHKPFRRMHSVTFTKVDKVNLDLKTKLMGSSSVPLNDGNPPSPAAFFTTSQHNDDYLVARQSSLSNTHGQDDDTFHIPSLEPSSSSTSSFFSRRSSSDSQQQLPQKQQKQQKQQDVDSKKRLSKRSSSSPSLSECHNQQWVRSGYFQYEMQFLVALSDIAERLVALPKHARVSALHAELTLLNHNLPAEICLPLWCSGSCTSLHHRVVRVSPSDAVVLNSAERAPYLLMIEVLEDGMCLEPENSQSKSYEIDVPLVAYKSADSSDIDLDKNNDDHNTTMNRITVPTTTASTGADLDDSSNDDDDDTLDLGTLGKSRQRQEKQQQGEEQKSQELSPVDKAVTNRKKDISSDFSRQMRTAAIMLAQLQQQDANDPSLAMVQAIRQRVIDQMVSLEEQRLAMVDEIAQTVGTSLSKDDDNKMRDAVLQEKVVMNKEDPSAVVFSEAWEIKKERIRANSPYGHLSNWRLLSVIVKQGTDLRQEQFAIQLIREMQKIWQDADVSAWVKYYRVLVTSDNSGLIETIRNTMSIHSIKKNATKQDGTFTLRDFFEQRWGPPTTSTFKAAQDAFMKSLVGYSIACYLLQIKDRHNGNLLLDDQGHLIHIDFGFVLSNSPGSVGFEMAPFKLSQEYIDILDGMESDLFAEYRVLMKQAFKAVRKYGDNILILVEMMSKNSNLPCFQYGSEHVLNQLRERFQFHLTEPQLESFVDKLIINSCGNLFTRLYDTFQYYTQGIL